MIYWAGFRSTSPIGGTPLTATLFPKDGRYLVPVKVAVQQTEAMGEAGARVEVVLRLNAARPGMTSGWNCASLTTRSSAVKVVVRIETPRTTQAKRKPGCRTTSREGARTQRAGTDSDDGRHSRLISP